MKGAATKPFVLDASVTLAWCFPGESTSYTEHILDLLGNGAEAVTPAIWPLEVSNALLVGERRKRISPAQISSVLQRIINLPISVDGIRLDRSFGPTLSLARQVQLTAYDASYLELALREALPVATLDDKIKRAAKDVGVPLVVP